MNQKNKNQSLDILLQDSIKVQSINLTKKVFRCRSSENSVVINNVSSKPVKTTKSVQKTARKLAKYPISNIPLGLEEKESRFRQDNIKKKSSTLEILEKLKQIDVQTQNTDVLEQTNDEIKIAHKQLQELQKLIARKLEEQKSETDEDVKKEIKHRQHSVINNDSRQLNRLQKKYLNKTRIRYKTLQDVENLTLAYVDKRKKNEIDKQEKQNEVKVLYSNTNNEKTHGFQPSIKKKTLSLEKKKPRLEERQNVYKRKVEDFRSALVNKSQDRLKPLLRRDHFRQDLRFKSATEKEINKIRYLLKSEHGFDTKVGSTTSEVVEMDNNEKQLKSVLKSFSYSADYKKNTVGRKYPKYVKPECVRLHSKLRKARFQDPRLEDSILNCDNFSSSADSYNFDLPDESSENITAISSNVNNNLITLPKTVQNGCSQADNFSFGQRHNRNLNRSKLDGSTSTVDSVSMKKREKTYMDGKRKLNLLLYGRDKLPEEFDDTDLADSKRSF
ncbi:uncharacterized protein LOC135129138 [Zophobas morio]|uniref:uncharacterized protein LOC135129138 n=1 Tax=Zophobas morio TaxID=2755281 RepID=UPI003083957A